MKRHNHVSITALRGRETLTSVGFTLQGYVDEISPSYLNKIFEIKPEMHHIYANKTEDFDTLFMQIRQKILIPYELLL
ncbi:hypothetical protein IMAU30038_01464 [Lactobacillus helveticus]|nr:hypothetical protein [Lactobacillus helveticus]